MCVPVHCITSRLPQATKLLTFPIGGQDTINPAGVRAKDCPPRARRYTAGAADVRATRNRFSLSLVSHWHVPDVKRQPLLKSEDVVSLGGTGGLDRQKHLHAVQVTEPLTLQPATHPHQQKNKGSQMSSQAQVYQLRSHTAHSGKQLDQRRRPANKQTVWAWVH